MNAVDIQCVYKRKVWLDKGEYRRGEEDICIDRSRERKLSTVSSALEAGIGTKLGRVSSRWQRSGKATDF